MLQFLLFVGYLLRFLLFTGLIGYGLAMPARGLIRLNQAGFFISSQEFKIQTDTLKQKKLQRKTAYPQFWAYNSYTINSDSLMNGKGDCAFVWVDSFRDQQNQIVRKPLLWSPHAISKSMPESELTNLLADILLMESRQIWDTVDGAMLNPGGIRAGFPADTLRLLHVMEALPFPNRLDKLTLSGSELVRLLDHWAAKGGIALSGLRITIHNGKAIKVEVGDEPLNPNRTYHIALPDYLVDGGDGCSFLMNSRVQRGAFRITDLVARHLEAMGSRGEPLKTQTDGRIQVQ